MRLRENLINNNYNTPCEKTWINMNNNDSTTAEKTKIIKRILRHSNIYTLHDLQAMPLKELANLHDRSLIKLIISTKFRNRHKN